VTLNNRFATAKPARKGPTCSVKLLLASMDEHERDTLIAAFDDETIQSRTIWRVLIDEGYEISDSPIGRHRRGLCLCSRKDLQS